MAQTEFKVLPDAEDLQKIGRDLRFHPSTTTDPQVLKREQIEEFNRDGYVRPLPIFSTTEIAGIRTYFDDLLAKVIASGGDSYSISSAHLKYGKVWDILTHPKIVACVKDVLGENIVGWGSHFFCKMPGDGKAVAWHQDSSYWPLTPAKAVTVWLAIDDADPENAGAYRIFDSVIEASQSGGDFPPNKISIHLYVSDCDAVYAKAIEAGAKSIYEVSEMPYGERSGGVEDICGNSWWISTQQIDMYPNNK